MSIDTSPAAVEALKPCPFCGGEATLRGDGTAPECWVSCACGASSDTGSKARIIAAWNRRATPEAAPVQGRVRDAIRALEEAADKFFIAKFYISDEQMLKCCDAKIAEMTEMVRILSALEPAEAQGWQPIETAPKTDEDHSILVTGWLYDDPSKGRWQDIAYLVRQEWTNGHHPIYPPTHWRPLPTPPEAP